VDARWTTKPVTEIFREQNIHHAIMAWTDRTDNLFRSTTGLESATLARETQTAQRGIIFAAIANELQK
jgi:hypothetical protein